MAEPIQIQQLGGTTEQLAGFTGKDKVIVINTDTHRLHIQDGKTPGGLPGGVAEGCHRRPEGDRDQRCGHCGVAEKD